MLQSVRTVLSIRGLIVYGTVQGGCFCNGDRHGCTRGVQSALPAATRDHHRPRRLYHLRCPRFASMGQQPLKLGDVGAPSRDGPSAPCSPSHVPRDPEWEAVEKNFKQQNRRRRMLQQVLPIDIPYRLISRADIEADDARLKVKYPGIGSTCRNRWSSLQCPPSASIRQRRRQWCMSAFVAATRFIRWSCAKAPGFPRRDVPSVVASHDVGSHDVGSHDVPS